MKEVALGDLQGLGKLLKGFRRMTKQEIENFYIIPEGATMYPDYESYLDASKKLREVHHRTFCNRDENTFWTIEL